MDYDGRAYLYRELYGCRDGQPNTGVKEDPRVVAQKVAEIEKQLEAGNHITGIADPAIWDESHGMEGTIISLFRREGIDFSRGKHDRISGKMQCHYRMRFDEEGYPMMYVFKTCKPFIRTIPNLIYDENKVEDVNTNQEDHDYDAMRYFFMANPLEPQRVTPQRVKPWNPLDI